MRQNDAGNMSASGQGDVLQFSHGRAELVLGENAAGMVIRQFPRLPRHRLGFREA